MRWVSRVLNCHPGPICSVILLGLALAMWAVHDYIEHTVRPRQQAARQARISVASSRAEAQYKKGKFDRALEEYRYILQAFDAHLRPHVKGRLHSQIGLCYIGLADTSQPVEHLTQAIDAFAVAFAFLPVDAYAMDHARAQIGLGDTHVALTHVEGKPEHMDRAIQAYQTALDIQREASNPAEHASTLNRLGNVYRDHPKANRSARSIDRALAFYQQALEVLADQPYPREMGQTHLEMGQAYIALAKNGTPNRWLNHAIAQFQAALAVLTADAHPQAYGIAHRYLGDSYTMFAEIKPRPGAPRSSYIQRAMSYRNKAKAAYRIAENFGLRRPPVTHPRQQAAHK